MDHLVCFKQLEGGTVLKPMALHLLSIDSLLPTLLHTSCLPCTHAPYQNTSLLGLDCSPAFRDNLMSLKISIDFNYNVK